MNSLSSLTASQMRFRTALFSWMIASVALLLLVAGVLRQQKASLLENLDSQAQGFAAAFRDACLRFLGRRRAAA